jgi:hypothetical protein
MSLVKPANVIGHDQVSVTSESFTHGPPPPDFPLAPRFLTMPGTGLAALKGVISGAGATWTAVVTLTGPGDNLGVNQINVGFVQHITIQAWNAQYNQSAPRAPTHLVSNLQGQTFLDMLPDGSDSASLTSTYNGRPWYSRQPSATFFNATAAHPTQMIKGSDQPGMWAPLTIDQSSWEAVTAAANTMLPDGTLLYNAPKFPRLNQISLIANFTLDVAASTTDTSNGANNSYWAEDRVNWTFNGTGTVGPLNPRTNNILWVGDGAGIPDASWSVLAAPTLENTSGDIFNNQALRTTFTKAP